MNGQVTLQVTMELKSDAVFGSGFSIPGGEDVAVCEDEAGYPYLKGTTFKGLLRESLQNELAWSGKSEKEANLLLGESDWSGTADERRIHLTELKLSDAVKKVTPPTDCVYSRTFTSLENGVVKAGTLRTASCICRGLQFEGELTCREEDVPLLKNALRGIKWAGTMRFRGFGRVSVSAEEKAQAKAAPAFPETHCIHYRLHTVSPVLATDLGRSCGNSFETRGYLPGSSIRGMVMSCLAAKNLEWFAANKTALLTTRFLDAVPNPTDHAAIPSIKGFYEDKEETRFESVVTSGEFTPGLKRAKLGTFCALDEHVVRCWSAASGGVTRIRRDVSSDEETRPFRTRYLNAGQDFEGFVLLDDAALAPEVAKAFSKTIWLGADRYEGFGKCRVTQLDTADEPDWLKEYGCQTQAEIGTTLYLLAVSPLAMLDAAGNLCGLDIAALKKMLGVGSVTIQFCSTSASEYGGYNRTWKCRAPSVQMYDRGSVFKLVFDRPPQLAKLQAVEQNGLGIRKAEGYGQILFFNAARFEGLNKKDFQRTETPDINRKAALIRRAKYLWVEQQNPILRASELSSSQIGSIQALCEKAIAQNGDTEEIKVFLKKNREDRGSKQSQHFEKIQALLVDVLGASLSQTLQKARVSGEETEKNNMLNAVKQAADSKVERLKLLCLLFDYSRRGGKKEEK